jgi:hypothetical protein
MERGCYNGMDEWASGFSADAQRHRLPAHNYSRPLPGPVCQLWVAHCKSVAVATTRCAAAHTFCCSYVPVLTARFMPLQCTGSTTVAASKFLHRSVSLLRVSLPLQCTGRHSLLLLQPIALIVSSVACDQRHYCSNSMPCMMRHRDVPAVVYSITMLQTVFERYGHYC